MDVFLIPNLHLSIPIAVVLTEQRTVVTNDFFPHKFSFQEILLGRRNRPFPGISQTPKLIGIVVHL